jgi:hypothetical protein
MTWAVILRFRFVPRRMTWAVILRFRFAPRRMTKPEASSHGVCEVLYLGDFHSSFCGVFFGDYGLAYH